jgi:small multidrug resistance pump
MAPTYAFLALTILFEAFGTACIQASQQFTRVLPSLGVILGYGLAFWFLALALRDLPLGVAYAIWSGCGVVLATLVGWLIFGQTLGLLSLAGLALVATGIALMQLAHAA